MEEQEKVRVVITEDHVMLRQGLIKLLEEDGGIEVTGEASNGVELLQLLKQVQADVVLMDINMPVMDGFAATEILTRDYPDTKVVVLSMLNSLPFVQKMLSYGAAGYLLKTAGKEEVCSAIKLVAQGGNYISGELSVKLITTQASDEPTGNESLGSNKLSSREVEILELISEGYTNAEIADKIFTSKRTVETHRQNILAKTGTRNTANLIKLALEKKIIRFKDEF